MLKCSTSLWSADLVNLAADIKRVEPYSERFHIDVADGHYIPQMLFFPDQVAAVRKCTTHPIEVHLMTNSPRQWIEPFAEAGADVILFDYASARDAEDVTTLLNQIRDRGKQTGLCLQIHESLDVVDPHWDDLDVITIVGTRIGVKGVDDIDPAALEKMRAARQIISQRGLNTQIQADGAIRRHTVPKIAAAGADWIVPGSLMFKEDPEQMLAWLATLDCAASNASVQVDLR